MYLKSLALKGFKSFADRCSLVLQPGITAIVGPNGSGKSNICDAVLWVLGERNAKHLRGQAMEDVVFAGSATRKAAGFAEVELVLDNSDRTIPVDYTEVALTRRMYRTGESEYLINGIVARRLDVIDILHDSGLGTDTHSIISQGALDQILRSKPEDRRMLIEEAAGVLKHKQRKEKSARKLQLMEGHLARVRDVTAEINRQLGPLERKASRAKRYEVLSAELGEVTLALAVDDLRHLQRTWDDIIEQEKALVSHADEQRAALQSAQVQFDALQERLRIDHQDAGELNKSQRRIADVMARYEKALLLIQERERMYRTRSSSAAAEISRLEDLFAANRERREEAEGNLSEARLEHESATKKLEEFEESAKKLGGQLREAERELSRSVAALREKRANSERAQQSFAAKRAELASEETRLETVRIQREEAEHSSQEAQGALGAAEKANEAAEQEELSCREASHEALRELEEARVAYVQCEKGLQDVRERAHRLQAQKEGLEQAQWTARATDAAASAWLLSDERLKPSFKLLSKNVKTEQSLEFLVEQLLGEDLEALLVESTRHAEEASSALASASQEGFATLLLVRDESPSARAFTHVSDNEDYLLGHLSYPKDSARSIEALLGNVVLCESFEEALRKHAEDTRGRCYATPKGEIVWPSGKMHVGSRSGEHEGVLGVERRIDDLGRELAKAQGEQQRWEREESLARERRTASEAKRLEADRVYAEARGAKAAAAASLSQAKERFESSRRAFERAEEQCRACERKLAETRGSLDDVEPKLEVLRQEVEQARQTVSERERAVNPLRERVHSLDEELSGARLAAATLRERLQYLKRTYESASSSLATHESQLKAMRETAASASAAAARLAALPALVNRLQESLALRSLAIDHAVSAAEEASSSAYDEAARKQKVLQDARDALDATNEKLAELRVEKGRLEMRVHGAVKTIEQDCKTPLDRALQIEPLEAREETEERHAGLVRRIANLGTINPDAAVEYDALKARYDFLAGQLADLEEARRSLTKITRAIDGRLKDDFVNTFHRVNENFQEIFTTLFPGGEAHLILDDPDDVENTGIEVKAQPRGKRITKMSLLSGGEKSLTALALLFAIYKTRATPFYILDEVEAALDDTNLRRFIAYLDELRETTQLILITHQRRTMEMADVLFGVSMHGDGVTKVLSQKLTQNRSGA